ncbi:MAG: S-layer homology domain-containing protein [Trichodesmium sp. St19_bin2]|nr:S-layer homology domain-containing protein [Trichodesmium sp. St5_bin8]MDE5103532.1 S-layer homology domain-containing protein [Trichodesmium sp. St19_bin2]
MTDTPTKLPSQLRPVKLDEWIAIFVALGTFGSIFFWATTGEKNGFNLLSKPMPSTPLSESFSSSNIASGKSIFSLDIPQLNTSTGKSGSNFEESSQNPEELGTSLDTLTPMTDPVEDDEANLQSLDKVKTKTKTTPKLFGVLKTTNQKAAPPVADNLGILDSGKILSKSPPTISSEVTDDLITTAPLPVAPSIPTPTTELPQEKETSLPSTALPSPDISSSSTVKFSDVPNSFWASSFIQSLVERDFIPQVNNDQFEPDKPVTRAEFAAQIAKVFEEKSAKKSVVYKDIKGDSTSQSEIQTSTKSGFLSGYPGDVFRPEEKVSRLQVLVSLASGLSLEIPSDPDSVLSVYKDTTEIPDWAKEKVAAATAAELVVSHPDVKMLNPNQPATRAEVAAVFYQALVKLGQVEQISSEYIVNPKKEN